MEEGFLHPQSEEKNPESMTSSESLRHLDVGEVMKDYNAYFVHVIQVSKELDVSSNNESLDTKNLSVSDKLDILYAANPSISASTIRPHTQDGTFRGNFGVLISSGEITSAYPTDNGSTALSIKERVANGGDRNSLDDVEQAINREHTDKANKSYNEIAIKESEVAGGFYKLQKNSRVSYEDVELDYGETSGTLTERIGVLDMSDVYRKDLNGNPDYKNVATSYSTAFNTIRELDIRGPVFIMDDKNQLFIVKEIDVENRRISFSTTPFLPKDVAEIFGNHYISKERREELINNLQTRGVNLQ